MRNLAFNSNSLEIATQEAALYKSIEAYAGAMRALSLVQGIAHLCNILPLPADWVSHIRLSNEDAARAQEAANKAQEEAAKEVVVPDETIENAVHPVTNS